MFPDRLVCDVYARSSRREASRERRVQWLGDHGTTLQDFPSWEVCEKMESAYTNDI